MQTTTTNFTVAEYCEQIERKQIVINREYQRSEKVWPNAARSFLIDTILNGYPIPKLSLSQRTILREKKTFKEVVDGQQRTMAIYDFFHDHYALTKGDFVGKRFSTLEPDQQAAFMEYSLSADIFSGADDGDIREVFRRINSYTIPLNKQEHRHAVFQGPFKWFIFKYSKRYSEFLRKIGAFNERQLSRMADAELLTEFCEVNIYGIRSASQPILDEIYKRHDADFPEEEDFGERIDSFMNFLASFPEIHGTDMTKRFLVYSLYVAYTNCIYGVDNLKNPLTKGPVQLCDYAEIRQGLTALSAELAGEGSASYPQFVYACSRGTNRINQRSEQVFWLTKAITGALI